MRVGVEDDSVRLLQEYLNFISRYISEIPAVNPTGYFGTRTEEAVVAFQNYYGVTPSGIVGPVVWGGITDLYTDLYNGSRHNEGQFPGFNIGE